MGNLRYLGMCHHFFVLLLVARMVMATMRTDIYLGGIAEVSGYFGRGLGMNVDKLGLS